MPSKRKKISSPGQGSPADQQVSGLSEEICDLKDYIKAELSQLREEFKGWSEARLAAVEHAVEFALDSVSAASAKAVAAEAEAKRAISGLETVSERLRHLEDRCDNAEQNSRLDLLVFSGKAIPKSRPDENSALIVRQLLEEHMGYRLNETEINRAHRIPSGKIVVKFNRTGPSSEKEQVWKQKSRLRGKNLYVQESLTERRQEIFQALLQARRDGKIFSVFTQGGKVYYKMSFQDFPHRASSVEAVADIVRAPRAGLDRPAREREQGRAADGQRSEEGSGERNWPSGRAGQTRSAWTERERARPVPPDTGILGSPLSRAADMPRAGSAVAQVGPPASELTSRTPGVPGPPRTDDVVSGGGEAANGASGAAGGSALDVARSGDDVTPVSKGTATLTGSLAQTGRSDRSGPKDNSTAGDPAACDTGVGGVNTRGARSAPGTDTTIETTHSAPGQPGGVARGPDVPG